MFTPQEVSEKVFPKASFGGYNMSSVDEFLDTLTEDYTALFKENAALKAKLKVLAEKIEEYRATEDAMRSTLLTAQKMASQLVQQAHEEREQILSDTQNEAKKQAEVLAQQTVDAENKLALAKEKLADFIARSQELCTAQTEFLRMLPEADVPTAVAAAQTDAVTQDTVRCIGQDILRSYAAATAVDSQPPVNEMPADDTPQPEEDEPAAEVPQEEPTQEPAAPGTGDDMPLFADFNLEDLKFGRNYEGKNN